jgi:peptidyl-prolyl isomerase D
MPGTEYLTIATTLKDLGNRAFKAGYLNLGLDKYQKGLRYLNEYPEPSDSDPPDLGPKLRTVRFTLHSNSALLAVKLKHYDEAQKYAGFALDVAKLGVIPDADMAKAYYRRAMARVGMKDEEDALADLTEASKLAPGDAGIAKEMAAVKKTVSDRAKKEKAALKKFFD